MPSTSLQPEAFRVTLSAIAAARACDDVERALIRRGCGLFHVGGEGAEINALLHLFLAPGDRCFLHWRDRALRLARGLTVSELAAGFFATSGTEGSGRSMTCHESSFRHHVYPVATPVASHCLPACGAAWDQLMSGPRDVHSRITICTLGDGSTRQGEFFEAVAFAIEKHLPILFVVIDNGYAISTRTSHATAFDLGLIPSALRTTVIGWSPDEVIVNYGRIVDEVRAGCGPHVIRLQVPRLASHTSNDDERIYRTQAELDEATSCDPVPALFDWARTAAVIPEHELASIAATWQQIVEHTYQETQQRVGAGDITGFTEFSDAHRVRESIRNPTVMGLPSASRVRDALNEILSEILTHNPLAIVFGQDIEDPLGGVFRLTKGLSSRFPDRVINAPVAEATILGVGCGMATSGRLVIAELQFIDFLSPGWNQLATNLATQSWRTEQAWGCPLIMYAPVDGYCPGEGIWHSQINASQLSRNTAITLALPSNPHDVARVFRDAALRQEPTMILIPKAQLWTPFSELRMRALCSKSPTGFAARHLRHGHDATVVAWGNGVGLAERAIDALPHSIELIDLVYLNPIDIESVLRSARVTGRLLVIDPEHGGASLASGIVGAACERISDLRCETLHRKTQFLGCSKTHEQTSLLNEHDILAAIERLIRHG